MAEPARKRDQPDKGWAPNGWYRCLGFGCGWGGWPFEGTACRLCGAAVPPKSMTQKRWRREVFDTGRYGPTTGEAA
jgi:hypothetical protein